ncbi:hypothetical protein RvY_13489 [Ramazzottius varieornatus]|uniref:ATPase V1 complex subunit H C-terminal domain-containing protein n=1 Tax=Ramazzottius varieornatus TaxID=947166 RepID=A0A1D1VTB4_RAMVA|nr:hypothetical protein RvY_13489 [Ramazzottius varieornatus]
MNVALAGVKIRPKHSYHTPLAPQRLHSEIVLGANAAATPPVASGTVSSADTSFFSFARHPRDTESDDVVGAPAVAIAGNRINPDNWVRLAIQADTEVTDGEEAYPISPMSVKAAKMRTMYVNWGTYLQSHIITQDQFDCITILLTYGRQKREELWNKHGIQCARLLVEMTSNISKTPTVQYLLTVIDDLLQEDRLRIEAFHAYAGMRKGRRGWDLFLPFLNRDDAFLVHQAARIIAKMACWSAHVSMKHPEITMYLSFLKAQLQSPANEYKEATLRCLQMMLRIEDYRRAFVTLMGVNTLVEVMDNNTSFQVQYQLAFCLWCLSFGRELIADLYESKTAEVLCKTLANTLKEKVVRIAVATLRNMLEIPDDQELVQNIATTMIHCRLMKTLQHLKSRQFADEDVNEDIDFLWEVLTDNASQISSFDEYVAELKSGSLEWSPVHKDDKFWRENATRFNVNNFELLKILIRLLEISKDPLVLSVALHDVGEYVRCFPKGKTAVEALGGKSKAMALLNHEDGNVRYQALLTVQKMLIQNWEFLGKRVRQGPSESDKEVEVT